MIIFSSLMVTYLIVMLVMLFLWFKRNGDFDDSLFLTGMLGLCVTIIGCVIGVFVRWAATTGML